MEGDVPSGAGVKNSLQSMRAGDIINSEGVNESKNASLTFEEESALLDFKSSESYKINSVLRDGDVLTDEEKQFVDKLDIALQKMPTYEGTVYRNLVFDDFGGEQAYNEFLNEHQVGNVIPYKAYTSASTKADGYPVEGNYVVKMEIQGLNAKDVDGFGNNFEHEVIFQRRSKFIVDNVVTNQTGETIIYLTEVAANAGQGNNGQFHTEKHESNMQSLQEATSQSNKLRDIPSYNTGRDIVQGEGLRGVSADNRGLTKADADDASAFSNAELGEGDIFAEPSVERIKSDTVLDTFARIENKKRYTPEQQELIDVLKDLGWTLDFDNVFVKDKNGKVVTKGIKAIRANGEVNRKQKIMVIDYKTAKPKIFVIGHEFVHFLEVNPVVLQEYINNVMDTQVFKNWMNEKGYSNITDFVNAVIDERLEKNDTNFLEVKDSQEDLERLAYCEIAADFTGEKVLDSYEKLQELVNSMEAPKRRSFLKIMKDFFSGIAEKIAIRRGGEKGFKAELNRLNRAFQKAYAEAEKTHQKENTADDSGVSYSVSAVRDISTKHKPIISKLTKKEISEQTYAILDRLERGEAVALEELETLPEVIEGVEKVKGFREKFLTDHPEFKEVPKNKLGTYLINSIQRERLRNKILQDRLKSGSFSQLDSDGNEVYNGSVTKGKRLDIVIGLPAAGKSTSIVLPLSQYFKSVVVDSDIIKQAIPEFNEGWGASLVHEESSDINMRLLDEELALGNNIVLPIVGAKADSLETYIELAKQEDYEIHLHLNELNSSKAMARMLRRYFSDGRFIPPSVSYKYGDKPTAVYEEIKNRSDISGYSHWNNDVAKGQRPTLTDISGSDRALVAYSGAWRAVRATDVERNDSETESQTSQIAPTKETSSKDDVFFDTKYSISTDTNSDLLNQYDAGEISREEFLERISEGKGKKTLTPKDIADLDPEVASTTPPLPRKMGVAPGDEKSFLIEKNFR